jgi:hypothetical protein
VNNDVLGITAQTPTGDRIAEWVYAVPDADTSVTGIGPAPVIVEQDRADLETLSDRMVAGDRLFFRETDEKQSTLHEVALPLGYDRAEVYAAMTGLQPVAQQAARAKAQGRYEDYRAENPRGGTCEKRGRFLTIASVGTVGLPDDCWELAPTRLPRRLAGAASRRRGADRALLPAGVDAGAPHRPARRRARRLAARPCLRHGARRAGRTDRTLPPGALVYRAMVGRLARRTRGVTPAGRRSFLAVRRRPRPGWVTWSGPA